MAPQKYSKKHPQQSFQTRQKRQKIKERLTLAHPLFKAVGIFGAAIIVGLSALGPQKGIEQYGAIAAEVRQNFSLTATPPASNAQIEQEQRIHHFAMAVVGGRSTIPALASYQRVEAEIIAKGTDPSIILRLQKTGRNQPIQEYERAVSETYFSEIWQRLRDLEVAQLTNLSPHTENLDLAGQRHSAFDAASATYSFHFKDGVYDYPNSFEVHAPEHLEDKRYQSVRDLTFLVLEQSFGDVLGK